MSQYNLSGDSHRRTACVLEGNWLEENALAKETGIRYYPSPKEKASSLMTTSRCISHSQSVQPKNFSSTTLSSYQPPQETREYGYSKLPVGPRARLLETQLKSVVQEEFERKNKQELDEKQKMFINSSSRDTFKVDGFTPALAMDAADYPNNFQPVNDTPITFFSDTIKRSNNLSFPVTSTNPAKPFRRQNEFSEQYANRAW